MEELALRVKAGYSGNVIVRFAGFTSWKIAGIVSIIACLFLMLEFADVKAMENQEPVNESNQNKK